MKKAAIIALFRASGIFYPKFYLSKFHTILSPSIGAWSAIYKRGISRRATRRCRRAFQGYTLAVFTIFLGIFSAALLLSIGYTPEGANDSEMISQWARSTLTNKAYQNYTGLAIIISGIYLLSRSPRTKLFTSLALCVGYIHDITETNTLNPWQNTYSQLMRNTRYRRKRLSSLAWAINRDCLLLAGHRRSALSTSNTEGLGQVLLWYDQNPLDKRRLPVLIDYLAEVIEYANSNGHKKINLDHAPSSRFRVSSSRRRFAVRIGDLVGGTLVAGLIIGIVTTVLKVVLE